MKKSVFLILLLLAACAQEEFCVKQGSGEKLSFAEAKEIAASGSLKSGCLAPLKKTHFCNENTGTWWIDVDIDKKGCSPACVVNVVTKRAEINWRCTGLLPS
jgi:hypothetical protein